MRDLCGQSLSDSTYTDELHRGRRGAGLKSGCSLETEVAGVRPDKNELVEMYRTMVRIRAFEEHTFSEWKVGGVPGEVHLYSGQEGVAAGVIAHLTVDDYVVSTHRGHGHVLAKGADPNKMMAEVFGRSGGYCRGKGGTMHMADSELGILGTNGIVGASLPIATGVGLACQLEGTGQVCVCFFGDGASNRGTFHESLDLAAVWNLPVVYVCENNSYAMSTHVCEHTKVENIADRGQAYGIPRTVVDGNDVAAVYEAAAQAIARARTGCGPTLLQCDTWRHHGHFTADPAHYRDPDEHAQMLRCDPLLSARELLLSLEEVTVAELESIDAEAAAEMDAALEFARNSPWPDPGEVATGVYSE